jgi:hypothetical protein
MTEVTQTSAPVEAATTSRQEPEPRAGRVGRTLRLLAATVSLTLLALVAGGGAQSAAAQTTSNAFGTLKVSKVTGHARNGATFVGHYRVNRFLVRNHKTMAVGRLTGTLTRKSGATRHVSQRVRMPLNRAATRAANGPVPTVGTAARPPAAQGPAAPTAAVVTCQVLNLVLGPLDLNLLGLVVHLDRVVLNITAVPGAGALLGNLLCAVVGLLDGTGIGGLNGILTNLLNALLGILQA